MEEVMYVFGLVMVILVFVILMVLLLVWLFEKTTKSREENPFVHGVMWTLMGIFIIFMITAGAVWLKYSGLLEEEPVQEQTSMCIVAEEE